jgi:hypothetical protein
LCLTDWCQTRISSVLRMQCWWFHLFEDVWSYSFFLVCVICLPHCNDCEAIWSAFSEDLLEKKRIHDTRYLVCLTFLFRGKVRISSSPRTWYEWSLMAVSRLSNYLCGKACAGTSCSVFQAVCHPSCTT